MGMKPRQPTWSERRQKEVERAASGIWSSSISSLIEALITDAIDEHSSPGWHAPSVGIDAVRVALDRRVPVDERPKENGVEAPTTRGQCSCAGTGSVRLVPSETESKSE